MHLAALEGPGGVEVRVPEATAGPRIEGRVVAGLDAEDLGLGRNARPARRGPLRRGARRSGGADTCGEAGSFRGALQPLGDY